MFAWQEKSDLLRARRFMKICIGVDYALRELVKNPAKSPEALAAQANAIVNTLAAKGIGAGRSCPLPQYLQSALGKLMSPEPPAVAAKSPRQPASQP